MFQAQSSMSLHECSYDFLTSTWQHIDDRNLWHGVATWLETEGCTSHVNQDLSGEGRVVDAHGELAALVLSLARYTLANEVHTVTHLLYIIY